MGAPKKRITVTVESAFVRAGKKAVTAGGAPSLNAWVTEALVSYAAKDALGVRPKRIRRRAA